MSRTISNVTTDVDWTSTASVEQPESVRYDVTIANAAVAVAEGHGFPPLYAPARFLPPGGYSFERDGLGGVRFRDWVAGTHASVSCTLLSKFDLPEGPDPLQPLAARTVRRRVGAAAAASTPPPSLLDRLNGVLR